MTDLATTVDELREDREHGASWMGSRTVEALLRVAEQPFDSVEALVDELTAAARQLAESRPRVGAIPGAAGRVLASACGWRHLPIDDFRQLLREEGQAVLEGRQRAAASIAIQLAPRLEGAIAATHSASGTVREALLHTSPKRVICTVSEPVGEGRAFADGLRAEGLDVELVADQDGPAAVADATVLLLGADTVFRDGTLCNKVGTTVLAQAAAEHGKPVIVAAEIFKLAPMDGVDAPDPGPTERELFELTAPELLTLVVTEEGEFPPADVAHLVDRTPFLREGYALLQPSRA
jgi:translation initiation factor 2B subunit (eIF-2B alpha/beta/delta family)